MLFWCQALCVLMSTNSEILPTDIVSARRTTKNEAKLSFRNGCHAFRLGYQIRESSGKSSPNAFCIVFFILFQFFRWTADRPSSVSFYLALRWSDAIERQNHQHTRGGKALPDKTLNKLNSFQSLLAELRQDVRPGFRTENIFLNILRS